MMANVLLGALLLAVCGRQLHADNTVIGFCNERINYTMARVISTNFVRVEVQSKEVSDQSTTFVRNTCRPTNRRLVGPIGAQCNTSGQPDHQRFNATIQCDFSLNRTTNGLIINVTSAGATTLVNISLDSGQCPSVTDVSAVQSGLGYNVTVQAEKPQCSGWGEVVSYNFTIVCETNCTNDYRDSGNSSTPVWVFPDIGTGVFTITVTAENSCGEQTKLAQKEISVGEPCCNSSPGCDTTCIAIIATVAAVIATVGALVLLILCVIIIVMRRKRSRKTRS